MAPNGFVNRSKGKSSFQTLWIGNSNQGGPGSYLAYSTAAVTPGSGTTVIGQLGPESISGVNASSGLTIWTLTALPVPGVRKQITLLNNVSGVFIKAPAGASFDQSTNTVIKSTYAPATITLIGLTSAKFAIQDVYPDTTAGGAPVGGITLSTTT